MKHNTSSLRVFILLIGLLLGPPSWAACNYAPIPNPHPDGIGKSYCDRHISKVMGWQGASWLERPQRLQEERTDLLIQKLNLKPGMVVGDIGAGTGHISTMMTERIAHDGVVWAVDIQDATKEGREFAQRPTANSAVQREEPEPARPNIGCSNHGGCVPRA